MSIDPTTDWLRATQEHPFASRPLGSICENGEVVKVHSEFADAIRIAVEINFKRARRAGTQPLRDANMICLAFWKDAATDTVRIWDDARTAALDVFGNPPRTNTVLSRMFDWQLWRVTLKGKYVKIAERWILKDEPRAQKPAPAWPHIDGIAQSEMRAALEEAWTGLVLGDSGESSTRGHSTLFSPSGGSITKRKVMEKGVA